MESPGSTKIIPPPRSFVKLTQCACFEGFGFRFCVGDSLQTLSPQLLNLNRKFFSMYAARIARMLQTGSCSHPKP